MLEKECWAFCIINNIKPVERKRCETVDFEKAQKHKCSADAE